VRTLSEHRCFGGVQGFYEHESALTGGPMRFGVYMPAKSNPPVVYYLAGLECNEQTFATKAGAQRWAAELGLALVTPDTSPRVRLPGDDASWDFGLAASYYVDATQPPWSGVYRMRSYIADELRSFVEGAFPLASRRGIMGHSVGGHGALTLGLTRPDVYACVSALAPMSAASRVPWGEKAFAQLLGENRSAWRAYDACELVRSGKRASASIRIDQGGADKFLKTQLLPEIFEKACIEAAQPIELHMHEGYDHGYYFVSSVVEAQLRHQARALAG
jgi:S-formylglutathione hydrolase